ncbi:MAG: hypothetical protein Q7U59_04355 [Lutibacter sp.]|nr:hypothetical protein [Lutibacter sp.]
MKFFKKSIQFLLFLAIIFMDAQELPPVENYAPEIYGAENQNWSISQSADNYMYVANSSGASKTAASNACFFMRMFVACNHFSLN